MVRKVLVAVLLLITNAPVWSAEWAIIGTDGDDRLIGTPRTDYFVGGDGADVFVINHLSSKPDEIADFEPDDGDTIELTFLERPRVLYQKENFSINRKGVVKIQIGNQERELVRLNQADLRLELDPRRGRYYLKFSKKF